MKKPVVIEFENSTPSAIPTKATIDIDLVEVPELPTVNGTYNLTVLDGVYTWTLVG